MFKKLAIAAAIAASTFTAAPAMAATFCDNVTGGRICGETSYRSGWDSHDYIAFTLYGYEWAGTISCRDNPSTYTWQFETLSGYAPNEYLREFSSGYCEGRLYG